MAVYYKFKSAKDYDSVMIDGHFISVGHLKEKIFELKHLGRGTDFDLVVTNAQTNEEYLDEGMLIPKNTSVLIRRVPGRARKPIVTAPVTEQQESNVENNSDDVQAVKGSFSGADPSAMRYAEDLDWDEFGNDLYAIPETTPVQSSIPVQNAHPVSKEDEDSKIKALIDTSALDWQHQPSDGFGPGRGFGRGMGGRMTGGRGFGRGGFDRSGFEKKTPPQGYICHRCKVPGHFIQHCPTNGDPNFDIKRVKPPTGIPKSMLMATPDGSYALPSGAVAVLKPNEAAFEKEIEGMPSTRSVGDLPPELHCPVCKEVMKDAVLTSKCCFTSFCDKCIRDHIISKSMCICGATNVLADDLLPNKTLRDTINRILESNNSSAENGGSAFHVQDMESRNPQAKVPSPAQSAASKEHQVPAPPPQGEETSKIAETLEEYKPPNAPVEQEKGKTSKVPDVSEATHDSRTVKEAASQGSALLPDEEVQQKPISGEAGKKKKKKKILRVPPGEMQWRSAQELAPENYMMPMAPSNFNPYWNGMQPGFDMFMPPYGGPMPPYMGYGLNPMDVAYGGVLPHDPFGGPACMFPYGPGAGPHRDLSELAMGFNHGPPQPIMSREEFEARKANDLKRKREMERRGEREMPKDNREYGREGSSRIDVSSIKSKSKSSSIQPPPSSGDYRQPLRHRSPERRPEPPRPSSKRRSDYYDHDDDHHHRPSSKKHDDDHHHRPSSKKKSDYDPEDDHPHRPSSKKRPDYDPEDDYVRLSSKKRTEYDQEDDYVHRPTSKKKSDYEQEDDYVHRPSSKKKSDYEEEEHRHPHRDTGGSSGGSRQRRSESPSQLAAAAAAEEKRLKASVFSRISFPENESKRRKIGSEVPMAAASNGYKHEEHKARRSIDNDSSDDDDDERHFKRRPSRYNPSPPPPEEEELRHSRGSRARHSHR